MEKEGTVKIFERSVKKNRMRYMNFYGDGNTKSSTAIENIYAMYRKVRKFECVGHVQKRIESDYVHYENYKGFGW